MAKAQPRTRRRPTRIGQRSLLVMVLALLPLPAGANGLCPCDGTDSVIARALEDLQPRHQTAWQGVSTRARTAATSAIGPKGCTTCSQLPGLNQADAQQTSTLQAMVNDVLSGLTSLATGVIETTLTNMTGAYNQLTEVLLQETRLDIALQEQVQRQTATMERQEQVYEITRDHGIQSRSMCVSGTASAQVGSAAAVAAETRQALSNDFNGRRQGSVPQFRGPQAAVESVVTSRHEETYCTEGSAAETGCVPNEEDIRLRGADTASSSIFDYGTLDEDMRIAAQAYCENFSNPVPEQRMTSDQAETPAGESERTARNTFNGRVSAAEFYCSHLISIRAEAADLQDWVEDVMPGALADGVGGVNPEADGISMTT